MWWIGARLIEQRERACDEAVLQLGNEAEVYVEGILNVCKFYAEFHVWYPGTTLRGRQPELEHIDLLCVWHSCETGRRSSILVGERQYDIEGEPDAQGMPSDKQWRLMLQKLLASRSGSVSITIRGSFQCMCSRRRRVVKS